MYSVNKAMVAKALSDLDGAFCYKTSHQSKTLIYEHT